MHIQHVTPWLLGLVATFFVPLTGQAQSPPDAVALMAWSIEQSLMVA